VRHKAKGLIDGSISYQACHISPLHQIIHHFSSMKLLLHLSPLPIWSLANFLPRMPFWYSSQRSCNDLGWDLKAPSTIQIPPPSLNHPSGCPAAVQQGLLVVLLFIKYLHLGPNNDSTKLALTRFPPFAVLSPK
jgi:hypothetical protein